MKRARQPMSASPAEEASHYELFKSNFSAESGNEKLVAFSMIPFLVDQHQTMSAVMKCLPPNILEIILDVFSVATSQLGDAIARENISQINGHGVDFSLANEALDALSSLLLVEDFFSTSKGLQSMCLILSEMRKLAELMAPLNVAVFQSFEDRWISFQLTLFKILNAHKNGPLNEYLTQQFESLFNCLKRYLSPERRISEEAKFTGKLLLLNMVLFSIKNNCFAAIDLLDFHQDSEMHHFLTKFVDDDFIPDKITPFLEAIFDRVSKGISTVLDERVVQHPIDIMALVTSQLSALLLLESLDLVLRELSFYSSNGDKDLEIQDGGSMNHHDHNDYDVGAFSAEAGDDLVGDIEGLTVSLSTQPPIRSMSNTALWIVVQEDHLLLQEIMARFVASLSQFHFAEEKHDDRPQESHFDSLFEKIVSLLELLCEHHVFSDSLQTLAISLTALSDFSAEQILSLFRLSLVAESSAFNEKLLPLLKRNVTLLDFSVPGPTSAVTIFEFLNAIMSRFNSGRLNTVEPVLFIADVLMFILNLMTSQGGPLFSTEVALYTLDIVFDVVGSDSVLDILKQQSYISNIIATLNKLLLEMKQRLESPNSSKKNTPSRQHKEQLRVTLVNMRRFISYLSQNQPAN